MRLRYHDYVIGVLEPYGMARRRSGPILAIPEMKIAVFH